MSIIYDDAPLEDRIHRALSDTFKHRAIETAQDVITGKRDACRSHSRPCAREP